MTKNKPVLMIHKIEEDMFNLPLHKYILTFDDGLYNHYHYKDRLAKISTKKIFFVSSNIVCMGSQNHSFTSSSAAHDKAKQGLFEDFMTIAQIKELAATPDMEIGCHSHYHRNIDLLSTLSEKIKFIKEDTQLSLQWFHNIGIIPTKFCFPYNNDMQGLYRLAIQDQFTEFYGRERIPVETLLHIEPQPENL
jgi:peptidoglycan/xylan/chitin deacetylase (PgdA/CDA1 family)